MYLAPSTSALTPRRYCCFSENWEFKSRRKCRAWSAVRGVRVLREWRCGSVNKNGSGVNYEFIEQLSDAQKHMIVHRLSLVDKLELESKFGNFEEDPIVGKLRTRLGTIHPIPSPPFNPRVVGLFVLFFFVGVIFDKVWTGRKREKLTKDSRSGIWPQVPTSFSQFFEKDLQRKESVEWVNMVLGKLWKVYRNGIENWIVGLLQPVIDDLKKPAYVQRVEIKQFSLGEEPLSVRSVERRTSRRVNDLQYQIGIRYTGGARMLLMLSLKFGFFPVVVPVGVRDFDIDGELWVKLRLIPSEPWIGAVTWAFVALPKIKFELAPFRLFNLMDIPVLSMFLTKLLTEDLPGLFVRPKKIYLDFEKGKAVGPVPEISEVNDSQEGNDYFGELSVTLVDARKLPYAPIGKPDPYVVLVLGDQVIRSKKNSQTTVIGPPGAPIWNQDFHLLVGDPRKERLLIQVKDTIGFTDFTIGTGEVELVSLEDTVPTDRILVLRGNWGLFNKGSSGEILLRLTYKAYVEDEDDDRMVITQLEESDDETSDYEDVDGFLGATGRRLSDKAEADPFMNVLSALLLSEEFKGIVASEAGKSRSLGETPKSGQKVERLMTGADVVPDSAKNTDVTGSVIFWLAVVASISVLIAISIDGSSIFNP